MSEDSKNMNGLPDSEHFSDEEIVKSHVELSKNKHEPTKNFLIAPLVFVFVFGCLIFVCSIQLAHSTNSFQLHPPVEVVELTPEEKESQRLERKFSSGEKNICRPLCIMSPSEWFRNSWSIPATCRFRVGLS